MIPSEGQREKVAKRAGIRAARQVSWGSVLGGPSETDGVSWTPRRASSWFGATPFPRRKLRRAGHREWASEEDGGEKEDEPPSVSRI